MIRKYAEIFCWKNVSSFCNAKATHIFSAKNIRILCIESAKTVNEMTLNELVKLTTLWTTGPWCTLININYHISTKKLILSGKHVLPFFTVCSKNSLVFSGTQVCDTGSPLALLFEDSHTQYNWLYYSRTSMARTSLGPYKLVRDIGSSSH